MGNSMNCLKNCKTTPDGASEERKELLYRFHSLSQNLKLCRAQVPSQNAESELRKLLGMFECVIRNWRGPTPEVGEFFDQPGEIDWLLAEAAKRLEPRRAKRIVDLVARSGYRDAPQADDNGDPVLRRTTALHHAARRDDCSVVVASLFRIYTRFDANYVDDSGLTHFHASCISGCARETEKFLELGRGVDANLVWRETGEAPLHMICARRLAGDDYSLEMFFWTNEEMNRTINVDARDKLGRTPLLVALKRDNLEAAKLLLRKGADPNLASDDGSTALHIVCAKNDNDDESMKSFLEVCDELEKRVDVDARDNEGNAALHLVLRKNKWDEAVSLLRRSADPNLTGANGFTPLHVICQRHPLRDDDTAELFCEISDELGQPVRLDALDNDGRTALQWAVASLLPNTVDTLLDRGADLSNFVFPTADHFSELFRRHRLNYPLDFNFVQATGLLACVECLEKRGYKLHENEALLVMKIFVNYGFYENCSIYYAFDRSRGRDSLGALLADQRFATEAKQIRIRVDDATSPSLHDLVQLRAKQAAELLTFKEYFELARRWYGLRARPVRDSTGILCARVSMDVFRNWSLGLFMQLINYQLPVENCECIIKQLALIDLYFVCLAAVGRGDVKAISIYA